MLLNNQLIPVGARVLIRDAEWRVTASDPVAQGGVRLKCTGLSELVRGKQAVFLSVYEKEIKILKPEEAALVTDQTPGFGLTKLYLEALIRTAPLTDDHKICVAHHAAMDPLPYQFNPALQALAQPRCRILIADAVGIGKTLEAGILVSELIARGRGKRILVLTTKAVLPQFQQEFWNRFSIALTPLDSAGIQRVRNRIPPNHNPFHYFDRSIISIDTLKQDLEYRNYLENAQWDIIIIDEAHNVADRGAHSQRSKLAKLLADRSDSMIMLSATPHDGRPESFASLLNILDPTAIANPHDYTPEDFVKKGLVIRRFKDNIKSQIEKDFPERIVRRCETEATAEENAVYDYLADLRFATQDKTNEKKIRGAQLFATTLIKAMFSSPSACLSVIEHRLRKLEKLTTPAAEEDAEKLRTLAELVKAVTVDKFSKFAELVKLLGDGEESIGWQRKDTDDRLVIFTESIETLDFLAQNLPQKLKLKKNQVSVLKGTMKDTDIAQIVNDFNSATTPVRLLLCSDVASEGINLHHLSHRMIHFDIPWSLMTFQQRNGRIDRYGQVKAPQIVYLQTLADNESVRGDAHILLKLQEKDNNAQKNLSDPREFQGTVQFQEDRTAAEMEGNLEQFDMDAFFNGSAEEESKESVELLKEPELAPVLSPSAYEKLLTERGRIFSSDMDFALQALKWLAKTEAWPSDSLTFDASERRLLLQAPEDLRARLKYLPAEILPEGALFNLTDDSGKVQDEINYLRFSGQPWPAKQLLWSLHPVMRWLESRLLDAFGRHSAPVIPLSGLKNERWALLQGGYPNKRGYIPVHRWVAVREADGVCTTHTLDECIKALGLTGSFINTGFTPDAEAHRDFVKKAVKVADSELRSAKAGFESTAKAALTQQLQALDELRKKHYKQLELDLKGAAVRNKRRAEDKRDEIDRHFASAQAYIQGTATLEDEPFLQLAAVFCPLKA